MYTRPTLLIDKAKCQKNIAKIAAKARRQGITLRPHFKTHQSYQVGRWFKEEGIEKITVSSLEMAAFFAKDGWKDITIAFPINILEIDTINQLTEKVDLNLLVESMDSVEFLRKNLERPVGIFIKVDVGAHRTGMDPGDKEAIRALVNAIDNTDFLQFRGFLSHAGHSYLCRGKEEIRQVYAETINKLKALKEDFYDDHPHLMISYGDTPTASVVEDFSDIDELRPGNFAYYDVMQWQIGSCDLNEIAVAVACPVVAIHPERNEAVIYGGAVHFSKDRIQLEGVGDIYGMVVQNEGEKWGKVIKDTYLKRISQEHGIIIFPEGGLDMVKIGAILMILPIHSCLVANLMNKQQVV